MFCENCGNKLMDGTLFCTKCGAKVESESAGQDPGSGSVSPVRNAGAASPAGQVSRGGSVPPVRNAGYASPAGGSIPPVVEKSSKKGVIISIIGGVVGLALVAVLVIVLLGKSGDGSNPETVVAQPTATPIAETQEKPVTESPTATSESEPTEVPTEPTMTPEPTPESTPESVNMSRSDCKALCDEIFNNGSVTKSRKKELMKMSNTILPSIYDKKEFLLSNISDEERLWVEARTLCGFYLEDRIIIEPLSNYDLFHTYDKEEALNYWYHFFGRDPEEPVFVYDYNSGEMVEQTGDTITYEWEEGDPFMGFYTDSLVRVYKNDSYYLVTGQMEFTSDKTPFAQVLIRKDEWALPGTVVYARRGSMDEIPIRKIKASSNLPRYKGKTYVAANMIDGKRKTTWSENSGGVGIGETIHLSLYDETRVHGIAIMNGYQESKYLYKINGKVKRISVTTDNGDYEEHKVDYIQNYLMSVYDLGQYSFVFFDQPMDASELTIEILNASRGKKYTDTCISELKLF